MKLMSYLTSDVYREYDKILKDYAQKLEFSDRTSVAESPTGQTTNQELKTSFSHLRKYNDFLLWGAVLFRCTKNLQYVRIYLQEKTIKISDWNKRERLLFLLSNSQIDFDALVFDRFKTPEALFGWLKIERNLRFRMWFKTRIDERVFQAPNRSRHRGYRDKGSLGKNTTLKRDIQGDVFILLAEQELEKRIKTSRDLTQFILEQELFDLPRGRSE